MEPLTDNLIIEHQEFFKMLWAMRQNAIDNGLFAERQLVALGVLPESQRRFYNRQEWRELTQET